MESEVGALYVNICRDAAMSIYLTEMGHNQPPTPDVIDSATGDVFVNKNVFRRGSRAIDIRLYLVRYRVRKGQFLVYWVSVEHDM